MMKKQRKCPQSILKLFKSDPGRARYKTIEWFVKELKRKPAVLGEIIMMPNADGELEECEFVGVNNT